MIAMWRKEASVVGDASERRLTWSMLAAAAQGSAVQRSTPPVASLSDAEQPAVPATAGDPPPSAEPVVPSGPRPADPGPGTPAGRVSAPIPGAGSPGDAGAPSDGFHVGAPADLRHACERLRQDVGLLALPLELPDVDDARRELAALVSQLDDYLLPRLRRIDAPLLAVVGGSTGAGKSTLVNSLVRRFVTRSGVLRPTTRSPVLVHHPYDSGAFLTQRILPGFARVTSEAPEPLQPVDVDAPRVTALRLVPDDGLAPGLAVIDAPDIDSLVETNRDLAYQLLASADLWVFVTTAARYADAVPWDTLRTAVDRGVSVAVVLNRVPAEAMNEVRVHLATLLRDRGLSTAPLFTIPETTKSADGFLPDDVVRSLRGWLSRLARDSRSRDVVVRRTLVGALDSLHQRVRIVSAAALAQAEADEVLRTGLADAFAVSARELDTGLRDGRLLQGEVSARWQEYVGSGEAFRGFEGTVGRLRDRVSAAVRGHAAPSVPLSAALRKAVAALAVTASQSAVEGVTRQWRAHSAGRALLRLVPGGASLSPDVPGRIDRLVQDWHGGTVEVVRTRTHGGRPNPRAAAFGVDGLAALLSVLAISDLSAVTVALDDGRGDGRDDGRDDADVTAAAGDAGATAALTTEGSAAAQAMGVVAHRLLTAVLGEDVGALAAGVRESLHARVGDLLASERARFEAVSASTGVREDLAVAMRGHLEAMERAR